MWRVWIAIAATLVGCRTRLLDAPPTHCGATPAVPLWSTAHHDAQRRSRASAIGPARYNLRWKSGPHDGLPSNITVGADGAIYLIAGSTFYAFGPRDGQVEWQLDLGSTDAKKFPSVSLDAYGAAYVTLFGSRRVAAVDLMEHRLRWDVTATCDVTGPPTVSDDGTLYLECIGQIDALDSCDGHSRWSDGSAFPNLGLADALDLDGSLLGTACDSNGHDSLASIEPNSGTLRWTSPYWQKFPQRIGPYVVGDDGEVFFLVTNGDLGKIGNQIAVMVHDLGIKTLETPLIDTANPLFTSALVVGIDQVEKECCTVFFGTDRALNAYAWRAGDFAGIQWRQSMAPAPGDLNIGLVLDGGGTLYATGSLDGGPRQLFALDGATGQAKWSADASEAGYCQVLVDGTLYCLRGGPGAGTFQLVAVGD